MKMKMDNKSEICLNTLVVLGRRRKMPTSITYKRGKRSKKETPKINARRRKVSFIAKVQSKKITEIKFHTKNGKHVKFNAKKPYSRNKRVTFYAKKK